MKNVILCFLISLVCFQLKAQNLSVSGKITDTNGEILIGATVMVKGTDVGTISDIDGFYSINDLSSSSVLVFSYVGMESQEVQVGDRNVINISLKSNSIELEEVVAVGYGSQKKINLTGAVETVKSDNLSKVPVSNVTNALAGKIGGVITRQSSGAPGSDDANIYIRGYGTPLVIVDGVEQDLNSLNPNEIESISVLKDASAAIYGARAGNGVILVTTKGGKIGKPTVSLKASYTMQGNTIHPEAMNSGQYAEMLREAQLYAGKEPTYTEEDIRMFYDGSDPIGHPNTNWYDETFNKWAPMQEYNLSISGGSKELQYFGYLGYLNQSGKAKSNSNTYNRYNLRMNVKSQITSNFSMSLNLSGQIGDLEKPNVSDEILFRSTYDALPTVLAKYPDPSKIAYQGFGNYNPVAESNSDLSGYARNNSSLIKATLDLKYDFPFLKGLSARVLGSYIQNTKDTKIWDKQYDTYYYDSSTDQYTFAQAAGTATRLEQKNNKSRTLTGQFSLNYETKLKGKHSFKGLALFEVIDYASDWFSAERSKFISESLDYLYAGSKDEQLADGKATESSRCSFVARFNYDYASKYLFETTLRCDASPNFPSYKRWGVFPSVSLAWRISEESFIKDNVSWLDNLKIRGGIGRSGIDDTGAFQYISGYNMTGNYIVDGKMMTGIVTSGLANENITWETMTNYNIGLDFSMFNSRFYGQLDFFYRLREGILAKRTQSLPNTFGAILPAENINSQNNRGFELVLGYNGSYNDFKYDVSGNIGFSRAKWVYFDEPIYTDKDDIRIYKKTGQWTDVFVGYVSDGLFTSQEEIDNLGYDQDGLGNKSLKPGDIKYVDINKDGKIDESDQDIIGHNQNPLLTFGLNINTSYKGFDLSLLFQGAAQSSMYLAQFDMKSNRNTPVVTYEGRWTEDNPNPNALFPRQDLSSQQNKSLTSDFYLKDASYFRLKNLSLGYTFPNKWLKRAGLGGLRAYIAGTNLFTISGLMKNYQLDPEAQVDNNQQNKSGWYYPQQKSISFGLEINF